MTAQFSDVVVVGGGMVGLTFASSLRALSPSLQITVLESADPQPPDERVGLRVSALSPASRAILVDAGVWDRLPAERLGPYRRMEVWRNDGPGGADSIGFDAANQGLDVLGYIVENDLLRWQLWQRATEQDIRLLTNSRLDRLQREPDSVHLRLESGQCIHTRLLIGADGAASRVRTCLGIDAQRRPYAQQGIVTHVATERPHQQTAWQRFLPGGPVALLPLADGRCSVVWSCPDETATELLQLDADEFGRRLTDATQAVLGAVTVTETPRAFPLAAAHATRYTGERFALLGDAAHQVHPLAGQGVNLGFQDAAVLADELACYLASSRYADPGDRRVLRRYERRRRGSNLAMLKSMDLLHQLFSTGNTPLAAAGALGLGMVDRLGPVKRRLAGQALGHRGLLQ
ncbi:MAG TPA: hypothetical protein ENK16_02070 [Chromatiales bacterium]|nr:hypothetical protein [Chromatiales bacterium]